jgi:hypothetical protein
MPRPSNPAARLVLDGQRTWVANQSIGGPIHAAPRWPRHSRILRQEPVPLIVDGLRFAIYYTKLHDRPPRPLLATSHQRHRGREKNCQPPTITPLNRSIRRLEDVVGRQLVRFGERDELTVRWELDPAASTPPDSQ